MKKRIKKIGVACYWSFPEGMAPTARILAYSKGLTMNDVNMEIVSFEKIYKDDAKKNNISKSGVVDGVNYRYSHFFSALGKTNKYVRGLDQILLRFRTFFCFFMSNLREKYDVIFLSFDDPYYLKVYTTLLKILHVPLVLVADEYPLPIRDYNKSEVSPEYVAKYKKLHEHISYRILMTEALKKFYNEKISFKPTHIMSNITDIDRFTSVTKQEVEKKYLCYMGNMSLAKDNVDNIIVAFSLIANKFTKINLHLYGTPTDNDKSILEHLIEEKKLKDRVFIMGRIGFDQVPQILTNAHILVTSQPVTKRAEGGFPTKMGEYMMCGVPTVLTDVGEIHHYIQDGVNAYMVEPCNPHQYADKLEFIMTNYAEALETAGRGKQYVMKNFSCESVAGKLIQFFENQLSAL